MILHAGIGPVSSLTLTLPPYIQWEEPALVSADVTNLMYNVSLSGEDLSPLTITINETQYCPELTPCQEYTVTVTPFSTFPYYVGMSTTITNATFGGSSKHNTVHDIDFSSTCFNMEMSHFEHT